MDNWKRVQFVCRKRKFVPNNKIVPSKFPWKGRAYNSLTSLFHSATSAKLTVTNPWAKRLMRSPESPVRFVTRARVKKRQPSRRLSMQKKLKLLDLNTPKLSLMKFDQYWRNDNPQTCEQFYSRVMRDYIKTERSWWFGMSVPSLFSTRGDQIGE